MQYYIWWIQDVNRDSYPMIFHHIRRCTVFIEEPEKERIMEKNTRLSSKENSSERRQEERTKLRNNRFAKCKNGNIWRRTWNRQGKKRKVGNNILTQRVELLLLNKLLKNILLSKSFVLILATEALLFTILKIKSLQTLIFLKKSNLILGKIFPDVGLLSVLSPGLTILDVFLKIMKSLLLLLLL